MRQIVLLLIASLTACQPAEGDFATPTSSASSRLSLLLGAEGNDRSIGSDAQVVPGRVFRFPDDHAAHPDFRNEWWYFTGHLESDQGLSFGYELTLFRFLLTPFGTTTEEPGWQDGQIIVGHFAVSDITTDKFYHAERVARRGSDIAGFATEEVSISVDEWNVRYDAAASEWALQARLDGVELRLALQPTVEPILNGDQGYSQKSADPRNASYYYSQPLLTSVGDLKIGSVAHDVGGVSWLDREWSNSALDDDQLGWDWFAITFEDRSTLMIYQLRTNDGGIDPFSSGTYRSASGRVSQLAADDFRIKVLDNWESPQGSNYPSKWAIEVAPLAMNISVKPKMTNQELTGIVNYWEGAVAVEAQRGDQQLVGQGYVELTGY